MNLLLGEEKCYLMIVFTELVSRIKENEQSKGRHKLSLFEFLDIAITRHSTCVPTSIPSIRMLSLNDVSTYKETQRDSARLHNHLVMGSSKDEDKPGPKSNHRKRRRHNNSYS
jgi:hypothetical protein